MFHWDTATHHLPLTQCLDLQCKVEFVCTPEHFLEGEKTSFFLSYISWPKLCLLVQLLSELMLRGEGDIGKLLLRALSLILPLIVVCVVSWQRAQNEQRVNEL